MQNHSDEVLAIRMCEEYYIGNFMTTLSSEFNVSITSRIFPNQNSWLFFDLYYDASYKMDSSRKKKKDQRLVSSESG
jgi:hypothetical protein